MVLVVLGVVQMVIEVVASHYCYQNVKKTPPGTSTTPVLFIRPRTIIEGLRIFGTCVGNPSLAQIHEITEKIKET